MLVYHKAGINIVS